MAGLPRHLGDGNAGGLGIGEVRPADDEAILEGDRLAGLLTEGDFVAWGAAAAR